MIETILVVGASNNPEKYGYKIVDNLKNRGFKVIPINPNESEVLGLRAYPSITRYLKASPTAKVSWVDVVVPPAIALEIVKEAKAWELLNIWLQPGSESQEIIKYCETKGMKCVHHACMMVDYPLK